MIIGITGTNGAGKGEVVRYLVEQKGFVHYSVRDAIVEALAEQGLPVDRPHMNEMGTALRAQHGPAYFAKLFCDRAHAANIEHAVIESIRSPFEADEIHAQGGYVLVVDADTRLRYSRVLERAGATDQVTFEQFCVQQEREMRSEDPSNPAKMDIYAVIERSDATIQNNGTLEELYAATDAALNTLA